MATMSDLPIDLVEKEILSRFPIISLRSLLLVCKEWKALAKNQMFAKSVAEAKQQFLGFMVMNSKVCSFKLNLQGILDEDDDVDPLIKQVSILTLINTYYVFHCDGLLLCVTKATRDNASILVWNPFLGQTSSIPIDEFDISKDIFALGYDDNHNDNRNHKVLRVSYDFNSYYGRRYEIYHLNSDSWKMLDATPDWDVKSHKSGAVSLKGNAYFLFQELLIEHEDEAEETTEVYNFLLCFDFTKERFGPRLPLPSNSRAVESVVLSCVREEKLAVLYQRTCKMMEIWITRKVETSVVLWSKFLNLDITPLNGFEAASFFVDEERKLVVVFDCCQICYLIGEDGYFEHVQIRKDPNLAKPGEYHGYSLPLACSSYVPSLVQLQTNNPRSNRTIHCKKCGQAGHNSRTCRKRARGQQYYQASSGSRASRMESKTCQSQPTLMEE